MATQLLLIHGRAQENRDPESVKREWIDAWRRGLAIHKLQMPLTENDVRLAYYGQTLYDYARGVPVNDAAEILFKGLGASVDRSKFIWSVLVEVQKRVGINDDQVRDLLDEGCNDIIEKGYLNSKIVRALLRVLDRSSGLSGQGIALATGDVYDYLVNDNFRTRIDTSIQQSLSSVDETVIVSHSLGTVVAYNTIRRLKPGSGVRIPLLVTLGSPLGITFVRKTLSPLNFPEVVSDWFNAMDRRDVVALYPLDRDRFPLTQGIRNKIDIDNHTENRHGIAGYLDDPDVALEIYQAVTK
jgi:hypothetical protein